jgi:uncharacterized protein
MERRMTPAGEIKVETRADGARMIAGYGAVFYREGDAGTEYRLAADVVERIDRRAFDRAMREGQDVRGLFNHDPNFALGSTAAGTMRMVVDDIGLRYEIDYNENDPQHVSVMQKVQRKDVKGSSFSFSINGKGGQRFEKGKDVDVRHILDVDLYDAGPVTFPAYAGASTGWRAEGGTDAIEARDAWRKEIEAEAVSVRCRTIALDNA